MKYVIEAVSSCNEAAFLTGGEKMPVQNEEFTEAVEIIRKTLEKMEFGSVTIMVQDGRIVSIESSEKFKVKLKATPHN
ncbi:MAG: YezD family protein [Ruminiclostridium sp.]